MAKKNIKRYPEEVYTIFAPKSYRGLKADYPELNNYEEFKISKAELFFVWYYACKVSPYYDTGIKSKRDRIEKCMKAATLVIDTQRKSKFLEGDFGPKVSAAVNKMLSFEPTVRIMAKLDSMEKYLMFQKLTSLELDDNGNHPSFIDDKDNVSFTAKKQYMAMLKEFEEMKPDLINRIENGYGVTGVEVSGSDKNYDDNGKTMLESYHSQ